MVELAIALSLLITIVYPFFYYGVFFTDLAAWKSTLFLNAREATLEKEKNSFTFGRYIILLNSKTKSQKKGNKAVVEGEAKVVNIGKLPFIKTINFPAHHEKYNENKATYKKRGFTGLIIDFGKGVYELLMTLVKSLWGLFSS